MSLTAEYLSSLKKVKLLDEISDKTRKSIESKSHKITYDIYLPKIRALEHERDELLEELKVQKERASADANNKITETMRVVHQVERILTLLQLDPKTSCEIKSTDITNRDRYIEDLGYLCEDQYLKIRAFAVENTKPVNKYSLNIYGNSLFGDKLIKWPCSYGLCTHEEGRPDIRICIKEFKTKEDLKKYYEGWKKLEYRGTWQDCIDEYLKLKVEYLEVINKYKISYFKDIFKYTCPKCKFFLTVYGADNWAIREGKCPHCGTKMHVNPNFKNEED